MAVCATERRVTGTRRSIDVWRTLVLAVAYVATARAGLMLDAVAGFATLVWPPTGISLAALSMLGLRLWPGVAVGALVVNLWGGASIPVAAGIAFGNTAEALLGAFALRRLPGFDPSLARVRDVVGFVALPALASTMVSATVGTSSLWFGGVIPGESVGATWRAWWLGDVMGDLVVAPLLMVWSMKPPDTRVSPPWIEMLTLATSTIVVGVLVFGGLPIPSSFPWRQPYLVFPVLAWAALRAGQRGTTTALFAISVVAIWGTGMGHGPFVGASLSAGLFALQSFMAISAVMFMTLAAATAERLHVARELGEAVRARDAFLSIASHELRTPLSALQLQVDMAARASARAGVGAPVERIDRIARQVRRLTTLIDNLLDVSRITAGALHLEPEELELRGVVEEVVSRHEAEARREGSSIQLRACETPVVGRWDRLRLDQTLENLLGNAIKYGAGKPIEVVLDVEGSTAKIAVIDHGIGIPLEHQARIFERFERIVPSKSYGGLGLGLWIVRQIVDALGGRIRVASAPGAGATFVVELPCSPVDASRATPS